MSGSVMVHGVAISWLTILWLRAISIVANCSTSLVTWSSSTHSSSLSISGVLGSSVALPEWCLARALGVVVGWAWTICLLLLVMLDHQNLPDGADKEEEDSDDGDCEDGSVESAGETEVGEVG